MKDSHSLNRSFPWTLFSGNALKAQFVSLVFIFLLFPLQAQVKLIKDINPVHDPLDQEYKEAVDLNGVLLFVSKADLWKTNSTTRGTYKLRSFNAIHSLTVVGNTVFFVADDGSGMELWKTTGVTYSTVRVKDIVPGEAGSNPESLTAVGNQLFFCARTPANGLELWKSNGTSAGTVLVKDIMNKGGSSNPAFLTAANNVLFFAANDGINGYELWKSDGTATGTAMVKDIRPGVRLSSAPVALVNVNGTVFFTAIDGVVGRELWKSDGTPQGTVLVKDILAGERNTYYDNLTNVHGTLFFSANDLVHGEELWKSDGTTEGTVLVKDLTPGSKGSGSQSVWSAGMDNFTDLNGKLYFTARKNGVYYFCKSDGSEAGTTTFSPATSVISDPRFAQFTMLGENVYFLNSGSYTDLEVINLMKESSLGQISLVKSLLLNQWHYLGRSPFLVKSRGLLYFNGRKDITEGYSLFKSNGTTAGTIQLADTYVIGNSSNPNNFLKIGNEIYFRVTKDEIEMEPYELLMKTDGTSEGTLQLTRMDRSSGFAELNGQLHFVARAVSYDDPNWHIYKTDGTPEGTVYVESAGAIEAGDVPSQLTAAGGMIFYIAGTSELWVNNGTTSTLLAVSPDINSLHAVGNCVYFQGNDMANGYELWRTDGTVGGTMMVKNINPGGDSSPRLLTSMNGILYFSANDGTHGFELWRSDGTNGGTYLVKDLRTGDAGDIDISNITATTDAVYIQSANGDGTFALWKSNGTQTGTVRLSIVPEIKLILNRGSNRIFFFTFDGSYLLWKSDGSPETTVPIMNVGVAAAPDVSLQNATLINDVLYFNFTGELWRSDGTTCGTYALNNVPGNPRPLQALASDLVFASTDPGIGRELFKLDVNTIPVIDCGPTAEATHEKLIDAAAENRISNSPNPFDNTFELMTAGEPGERYTIQILDLNNVTREQREILYNEKCTLGSSLTPGMYILRIQESNKMTTLKILKK